MCVVLFRVSRLTYYNLGFSGSKPIKIPLETAYVLIGDKCSKSCLFCSFSKKSRISGKSWLDNRKWLSRIDWMEVDSTDFFQRFNSNKAFKRVCFQLPVDRNSIDHTKDLLADNRISKGKSVSVSAWLSEADIDRFFELGVNTVALNVDVINPKTHTAIKGTDLIKKMEFISMIAEKYSKKPDAITTHVIVGAGETDRDLSDFFLLMKMKQIIVALFSYTPVQKGIIPDLKRPSLDRYRKIQLMKYLCKQYENGYQVKFEDDMISEFQIDSEIYKHLMEKGDPFNTSGCTSCTRPYYNDSPAEKEAYNYFVKLTPKKYKEILDSIPVIIKE